ncbi:SAM-dependent methyltransferase, partial [Methylobacterium trifolii]
MDRPPPLFDTALARTRLARARAAGYADFLLNTLAEDLDDRLAAVLRTFTCVLDLATPTDAAARVLAARYPEATRIRLTPLAEPASASHLRVAGDPEALP